MFLFAVVVVVVVIVVQGDGQGGWARQGPGQMAHATRTRSAMALVDPPADSETTLRDRAKRPQAQGGRVHQDARHSLVATVRTTGH